MTFAPLNNPNFLGGASVDGAPIATQADLANLRQSWSDDEDARLTQLMLNLVGTTSSSGAGTVVSSDLPSRIAFTMRTVNFTLNNLLVNGILSGFGLVAQAGHMIFDRPTYHGVAQPAVADAEIQASGFLNNVMVYQRYFYNTTSGVVTRQVLTLTFTPTDVTNTNYAVSWQIDTYTGASNSVTRPTTLASTYTGTGWDAAKLGNFTDDNLTIDWFMLGAR